MRAAKTEKEENMNAAWALQPRMSMKRSSESSKIIQKPIQRLSKPENRILRGSGCAVLCDHLERKAEERESPCANPRNSPPLYAMELCTAPRPRGARESTCDQ